jgi:hypothetical protein
MSGYRSLHRQQIVGGSVTTTTTNDSFDAISTDVSQSDTGTSSNHNDVAIWCIGTTPMLLSRNTVRKRRIGKHNSPTSEDEWRIWIACSDGYIRTFHVQEKSLNSTTTTTDLLDASAFSIHCTHLLGEATKAEIDQQRHPLSTLQLGCTKLSIVRNYIGDDTNVGDVIVVSLNIAGMVRIYQFNEDWDDDTDNNDSSIQQEANDSNTLLQQKEPKIVVALHEFFVSDSTGTTLCVQQPKSINLEYGGNVIIVAIGCLDGTIALVSTGITIYQGALVAASSEQNNSTNKNLPPCPGTIIR